MVTIFLMIRIFVIKCYSFLEIFYKEVQKRRNYESKQRGNTFRKRFRRLAGQVLRKNFIEIARGVI